MARVFHTAIIVAATLVATSAHAGVKLETTSLKTPREVKDCLLTSGAFKIADTNVVEIAGVYTLTDRVEISNMVAYQAVITPTETGSHIRYSSIVIVRDKITPRVKACAGE
jgi:hypothetical protein